MKSTGSTHRRTPINTWHRSPNTKGAVLRRIQTITKELEILQTEMHGEFAESGRVKTNRLFEDSATIEALNLFKVELDQLRRILWFYTEEATHKAGSIDEQRQQSRPENAGTLLRTISHKTGEPQTKIKPVNLKSSHLQSDAPADVVESVSFFERLDNVIDSYMQGKKPVSGETKPPVRREAKAFS